jgi:Right handed beta helix region
MNLGMIPVFVLALASAAFPRAAEAMSTTVNCPGNSITGALNAGFDDITVVGTCNEDVEIRQDDVTIQGGTVTGELTVNGARRVTIQNLTVRGDGTPGKNGILAINGAAVTIANVTVHGVAATGIAVNGSTTNVDGSTVENSGGTGIDFDSGSSGTVTASTIQNNTDVGVNVGSASAVTLDGNTGRRQQTPLRSFALLGG